MTCASISWSSNTSSLNSPEKVKRIGNKSLPVKVIVSENGCSYNTSWSECTGAIPNGAKMSDEEIEVSSAIFNAYPNPSEGTFVLETDGSAGEAYLISSLGQIIETIKLTEGVSVYNVSVSAKGSYLVRIKTTTANKSIKISVQ